MSYPDELDQIDVIPSTSPRPRWNRRPPGNYGGPMPRLVKSPLRRNVEDVLDIMGIPRAELTESVQEAIARLADELDRERAEAEQAREHVEWLEKNIDHHSFLPLINRRTLMRELASEIARVGRGGSASCFIVVHLRSGEEVRRDMGRRALDALLFRVADELLKSLRGTDVAGCLGGCDFGVILALADEEGATDKAHRLREQLESLRLSWRGRLAPVEVGCGIRLLADGDTVESVLGDADADLLEQYMVRR